METLRIQMVTYNVGTFNPDLDVNLLPLLGDDKPGRSRDLKLNYIRRTFPSVLHSRYLGPRYLPSNIVSSIFYPMLTENASSGMCYFYISLMLLVIIEY